MASFKEAFAAARKDGKKQFDFEGKSYSTEVAKTDSTRYQSGALKGMRRDPNEGETMTERSKRIRAEEQKRLASRPKAPEPKPAAKPEAKLTEDKGPSLGERFGKAVGSAAETARAGTRATADTVKAGARAYVGKVKEGVDEGLQMPGRAVEGGMRAVGAPAHARIFAGTLLGNRKKITEADFDDDEKEQLRGAARRATSGGRKGDIQYTDYDTPLKRGSLDRKQAAAQTVGQTGVGKTTREGKGYRVRDKYNYSNRERNDDVARYERMGGFKKAATVVKETVKDVKRRGVSEAAKRVPSRVANAYIGRNGREVDIKLARGGGIEAKGKTKGRFI